MSEELTMGHIRVSDQTKADLMKVVGELVQRDGKAHSLEDALKHVLREYKRSKT
jgi:hypothetical protein